MPTNPFGEVGSRGSERQIAEQTRALRAYEQARKRLISTMKGEERAVAGLSAAHAAAMQTRSRDSASYERELNRTSSLLAAQGTTLKNLDATRERFHREEMERSQSLLQRYENIKQALREIQEDSDNTSTILGSIVQPFKAGIDNMLKFGNIPKITKPIRDAAISFDDITGSANRSAGAAADLGRAMVEVAPSVWKYRTAIVDLGVEMAALKLKYADSTDGTEKLAQQFINLSKTDIIAPGAVKSITAVTDSLKYLEAQGVATETSLGLLVERSRSSGSSFEESASEVEAVAAQADILRESLSKTDNVLQGFAFTVRDDFVRAIADATRNLDSQVISVENVSAAYAFASKKAAEYGLSSKGAEKVAKTFGDVFFNEREDAFSVISGGHLRKKIDKALEEAGLGHTAYETADKEVKRRMEEVAASAVGQKLTKENRGSFGNILDLRGEGALADSDIRNILRGTHDAIESDLTAMMKDVGLGNLQDTSVLSRLLKQNFGINDLDTNQLTTFTRMLKEGDTGEVADQIQKLQEDAKTKAEEGKNLQSSALTAILTFKDPIQQLFNIKDFLKSIMLNVSNIAKLVAHIPGLGGVATLFPDTTNEALQQDHVTAAVDEAMGANEKERKKILEDIAQAHRAFAEATTDEAREGRAHDIQGLFDQLQENSTAGTALEHTNNEFLRLTGSQANNATAEVGPGVLSTLGNFLGLGNSEEGREAGVAMARRAVQAPRPDARARYERSSTRPVTAQEGDMEADGTGDVTVDAGGDSVMTVRMKIRNMGEVIAHHSSIENRVLDQFGLGGG